jgi:hypothetical protein
MRCPARQRQGLHTATDSAGSDDSEPDTTHATDTTRAHLAAWVADVHAALGLNPVEQDGLRHQQRACRRGSACIGEAAVSARQLGAGALCLF